MQLSVRIYTLRDTNHPIFARIQWKRKQISSKSCAHAMESPRICHNYWIYHKTRNCMHANGVERGPVAAWGFMLSLWSQEQEWWIFKCFVPLSIYLVWWFWHVILFVVCKVSKKLQSPSMFIDGTLKNIEDTICFFKNIKMKVCL